MDENDDDGDENDNDGDDDDEESVGDGDDDDDEDCSVEGGMRWKDGESLVGYSLLSVAVRYILGFDAVLYAA